MDKPPSVVIACMVSRAAFLGRKHARRLDDNVSAQVRKLQTQAADQVKKVKAQLKLYLKKHPLAAKYAKEPFLTWILYGITVITVTTSWALGAAVLGKLALLEISMCQESIFWLPSMQGSPA